MAWSRLSLDLEPYLTEHAAHGGTVLTFYHRQLADCVEGRFLAGAEAQARHSDLARHFGAKPAWSDEGRKAPNARRAVELVFQQRRAQQWTEAEATLFDCQFLFAKVAANLFLDLEPDYEVLLHEAPENSLAHREELKRIHAALRLSSHVIARDPRQFASQMLGRLLHEHSPRVQKLMGLAAEYRATPWLKPKTASLTAPGGPLLRVLAGHSNNVNAVAVTADGSGLWR